MRAGRERMNDPRVWKWRPPADALVLRDIEVRFKSSGRFGATLLHGLSVPEFRLRECAQVVIMGPAGSGKTVFLHLLAGLGAPSGGEVEWFSRPLYRMNETARDRWRLANVGLVFPETSLFRELTCLENVLLPNWFQSASVETRLKLRARQLLERVGVQPDTKALAASRSDAQRVGLVRAIVGHPPIVLADDPAAGLEPDDCHALRDLLFSLTAEFGATVVATTGDPMFAVGVSERYEIRDRTIVAACGAGVGHAWVESVPDC